MKKEGKGMEREGRKSKGREGKGLGLMGVKRGEEEKDLKEEGKKGDEHAKTILWLFFPNFSLIGMYCCQCEAKKQPKYCCIEEVLNYAHFPLLNMLVCTDLKHIVSKNLSSFYSNNVHAG